MCSTWMFAEILPVGDVLFSSLDWSIWSVSGLAGAWLGNSTDIRSITKTVYLSPAQGRVRTGSVCGGLSGEA